jgi:hypothetical protein
MVLQLREADDVRPIRINRVVRCQRVDPANPAVHTFHSRVKGGAGCPFSAISYRTRAASLRETVGLQSRYVFFLSMNLGVEIRINSPMLLLVAARLSLPVRGDAADLNAARPEMT